MNRNWVRFHLKEAHDALEQLVQEVEGDPEFDDAVYWPAMQHLYHHINMAWNARDARDSEVEPIKDIDFNRWSQFPTDLPMMEVGELPSSSR